jgi:hypothetical protein
MLWKLADSTQKVFSHLGNRLHGYDLWWIVPIKNL